MQRFHASLQADISVTKSPKDLLIVQALGLTRGEQLQIANLKPTTLVEVHLVFYYFPEAHLNPWPLIYNLHSALRLCQTAKSQ